MEPRVVHRPALGREYKVSEVEKLANALFEQYSSVAVNSNYGWQSPALNVLDCVLSLNRKYKSMVLPRVKSFAKRHPEVIDLEDLQKLIEDYASPSDFIRQELNYNDPGRAQVLCNVIKYLIAIQNNYQGATEQERLKHWAISVKPQDSVSVKIKGFKLSGFQYLRMLFGAQTTKPDVHIKRFVSDIVGHPVNDWVALELLEQAAQIVNLPLRDVDNVIWEERAEH